MSTSVFPSIPGVDILENRAPAWTTLQHEAVSGKETRVARRTTPRRTWELQFNFLRSSTIHAELQQLEAFFNLRSGMFDSFLFNASDDNSSSGQNIGIGDSTTRAFQLVRSFGGFSDPVYAPNTISSVYLNGVVQSSSLYSITYWGSTNPGTLTFSTTDIPAAGAAITADFTYYWPVRFAEDTAQFSRLVNLIWEAKKISFVQII